MPMYLKLKPRLLVVNVDKLDDPSDAAAVPVISNPSVRMPCGDMCKADGFLEIR